MTRTLLKYRLKTLVAARHTEDQFFACCCTDDNVQNLSHFQD